MISYTAIKYSLLDRNSIKFLKLNSKTFIILFRDGINYYFWVPYFLFTKKTSSHIFLILNGSSFFFYIKLIKNLILWIKRIKKLVSKKIIMRGLGLKAFFIKDYNILQLKLGFSKIINVSIPDKKIKLFLTKRRIIIVGYNIIEVNKFAFKIKLLKLPNIYKGKGLWYKNEKIILKTVRKT
jgi:hypothetical protein